MRFAIVSDIHGIRTAFEAVLNDLRQTTPDGVPHGGDIADSGSSPAEVVDHIRDLGWSGVVGNTDEMLFRPESLQEFANGRPLFAVIAEMAQAGREALGEMRLEWLRSLPRVQLQRHFALVHACPESAWKAPAPEASEAELKSVYAPLARPIAVYAHIHRGYIRVLPNLTVANTGSVSLSHDGDPRASYLLRDGLTPTIRRAAYNIDAEVQALNASGLPYDGWVGQMLKTASFRMP